MPILTSKNTFKGQQPGEKTILATTRHWIVLFGPMIILVIFIFLPFIIYPYLSSQSWFFITSSLYWFITAIYFLILWHLAFFNIMVYALNTVIITNKRIIQNEQKGFFNYNTDELGINQVQDASAKIQGPFATLLHYGDVEVQSAAAQRKFYFDRFPYPEKIKKAIMDLKIP
ncbi:PH domain-containing protein [Patescibacteria group bacterium]|nr:PH domain-containing protein [Patescibacteria group bacterium]